MRVSPEVADQACQFEDLVSVDFQIYDEVKCNLIQVIFLFDTYFFLTL